MSSAPTTIRVLVGDSDPFDLRLLQEICEGAGFDVRTAADGYQVLDVIARERHALIVLNLDLHGIDGLEICRMLRSDSSLGQLPIVIVASEQRDLDVLNEHAGKGWYQAHLSKPYRVAEVQRTLRNTLRALEGKEVTTSLPPGPLFDPATRLGTADQLDLVLEYELIRADRYRHPIGLLLIDLLDDGARSADDLSTLCRKLATMLTRALRGTDHLHRPAKDELVAVLPETNGDGIEHVHQRCHAVLVDGLSNEPGLSFRLSSLLRQPGDPASPSELLGRLGSESE